MWDQAMIHQQRPSEMLSSIGGEQNTPMLNSTSFL